MDTTTLLDRLEREISEDAFESNEFWDLVIEVRGCPERRVFDRAVAWTTDQDPLRRQLGAAVLGQLGPADAWPFLTETEPVLVGLLADAVPEVIECALIALSHQGTGDPAVISRLATHPEAGVRHGVAFCLDTREDALSLRTLLTLMEDEEAEVRDWATFGIGSMRDDDTPEIRAALLVRTDDEDSETSGEALVGLARRGDPRVIDVIRERMRDPDADVLEMDAAAEFPGGEFLADLENLAESRSDHWYVRHALELCREAAEASDD